MAQQKQKSIIKIRHPHHLACFADWLKWRYVYRGGDLFLDRYLEKFSKREHEEDYRSRKRLTPNATFAKAAVNNVKDSVFQRMTDISREGGSKSYTEAVLGLNMGVDMCGSSMNAFIGQDVLPELLTMSRVGVYVDMPPIPTNASMLATKDIRPYLYMYRVEDICSWSIRSPEEPDEYAAILLKDRCVQCDPVTYLTTEEVTRYRHVYINPLTGFVTVQFYNASGEAVDRDGLPSGPQELTGITTIPFVCFDIKQSLLEDVANHQIALLNLGSSDVAYALKANFPFYTEQADTRTGSDYMKPLSNPDTTPDAGGQGAKQEEIMIGPIQGRQYAIGADRPGFIHPSSEPLQASIQLQNKLKEDIRQLINLAVSNINPRVASAESKNIDNQGLESGLSFIGLVLENGERSIARYWSMYENSKPATIHYPENYSLKTDSERRAEAKDHAALMFSVPSRTFQTSISEDIIDILKSGKASVDEVNKMKKEVRDAKWTTSDPDIIALDVTTGLVSPELASMARGYPEGEAEKAQKAKADSAAQIADAQAKTQGDGAGLKNPSARGVPELDVAGANGGSVEKEGKPKRGDGKKIAKETNNE